MKKRINCLLVLSIITLTISFELENSVAPLQVEGLSTMSISTSDKSDSEVNAYYQGVSGYKGEELKAHLYSIIKDHTAYTYSEDVDIMKITDRDWTLSPLNSTQLAAWNPSIDTGIGDPYLKLLYGGNYNGTTSAVKWSDNHTTVWNKEHIWAKSHGNFDTNAPAGTDLHHLIAADQGINNFHSNYDYGMPTENVESLVDERGNPTTSLRGTNIDSPNYVVFAPPEEDRGDVARALFYMATRYFEWKSLADPKLVIVDEPTYTSTAVSSSPSSPGKMAFLKTLLQWNELDPVSDYEIHRNNLIDINFQHNRNPYIDHPEWVNIVYNTAYDGPGATIETGSACTIGNCASQEVNPEDLASISLNTNQVKTDYYIGETFSNEGLVVTAKLGDGSSHIVDSYTSSYADGYLLNEAGEFTVTISYSENDILKTATYSIKVQAKSIIPGIDNTTLYEILGASIIIILSITSALLSKKSKRKRKKSSKFRKK